MPTIPNTPFQRSQSPSGSFVTVTASSTPFVGGACRGVYIGGAGSLEITDLSGNSITFTALAVGVIHPIEAVAITSGTTATAIVIAYWVNVAISISIGYYPPDIIASGGGGGGSGLAITDNAGVEMTDNAGVSITAN